MSEEECRRRDKRRGDESPMRHRCLGFYGDPLLHRKHAEGGTPTPQWKEEGQHCDAAVAHRPSFAYANMNHGLLGAALVG
ncbi:unnamed protein product [Arctogadus glacialis]